MKKHEPTDERRIHARIKSSIGADVDNDGITNYTHLRNISSGGAFIHSFTESDFRIGQNVTVTLPSKKHDRVSVVSQIVWMNSDGIGVKVLRYN